MSQYRGFDAGPPPDLDLGDSSDSDLENCAEVLTPQPAGAAVCTSIAPPNLPNGFSNPGPRTPPPMSPHRAAPVPSPPLKLEPLAMEPETSPPVSPLSPTPLPKAHKQRNVRFGSLPDDDVVPEKGLPDRGLSFSANVDGPEDDNDGIDGEEDKEKDRDKVPRTNGFQSPEEFLNNTFAELLTTKGPTSSAVVPKTVQKKLLRTETMAQQLVFCMDPTCTSCPPEFHARRRKMARGGADDSRPKSSLLADLEEIDSDSDDDVQGITGKFRRLRKNVARQPWIMRLQTAWLTCTALMTSTSGLNPNSSFMKNWNRVFVAIMLVEFYTDPLFFFVVVVDEAGYCLRSDKTYVITLVVIRTICDVLYLIHMFCQARLAYLEPTVQSWRPIRLTRRRDSNPPGKWVFKRREILLNYLEGWFLVDVGVLLPWPQLAVLAFIPACEAVVGPVGIWLRLSILLQFLPRMARCYPFLAGSRANGQLLFESAWSTFFINLIMYVMSSHVVGAVWYLGATQRYYACAELACASDPFCHHQFLDCPNGVKTTSNVFQTGPGLWVNNGTIITSCVPKLSNSPDFFNYGLFVISANLAIGHNALEKYIYALQWGFTQISTLGGNQVASWFVPEIIFLMLITAGGLLLFAVLIGNIQTFLQSLTRRTFDYQLHRRDVENWMIRRNLPRELAQRVRDLERQIWAANQGVDEQEVLGHLSEDIQKDVRRHLCLDLIKKSKLFSAMEDTVLDVICARLTQRIYIDGTVVIREGVPVSRMFFVLKGELESTTTGGGRTGFFNRITLSNGDMFGEELLIAYLEQAATAGQRRRRRAPVKPGSKPPSQVKYHSGPAFPTKSPSMPPGRQYPSSMSVGAMPFTPPSSGTLLQVGSTPATRNGSLPGFNGEALIISQNSLDEDSWQRAVGARGLGLNRQSSGPSFGSGSLVANQGAIMERDESDSATGTSFRSVSGPVLGSGRRQSGSGRNTSGSAESLSGISSPQAPLVTSLSGMQDAEQQMASMGASLESAPRTAEFKPSTRNYSLSTFPKSERTIVCIGPVEGFSLEAKDLEFVCTHFSKFLLSNEVQKALNECSANRRTNAAATIQLYYRHYLRKRLQISMAHFYLSLRDKRLGKVIKWAIQNPGKGPRQVVISGAPKLKH
eukprot:TRINITY_DN23752_c0_g1_i1.p1 TRINITY_DN23752_c0_g1~~TRINITY_DN23752_c0_g1_i1.p1  ORF type:complete len:1143 (+),score=181.38 TRINITY_DN23752_c0_g1_i1:629-4057(+)